MVPRAQSPLRSQRGICLGECAVSAEYWFDSFDGLRLYSRVYPGPGGPAPTVVCVHGLMRNGRDFEDLAAHLAGYCRVLVPDVRGRGLSARDPNTENYQLPVYLQDLITLLEGLNAPRVAVIGTSMGGLMALLLAATEPERVRGIVLNDIGPEVDPRGIERIRSYAGRSPPVANWAEAEAVVRGVWASAWPGLSDERWRKLTRASYREDAQGIPRADADPRIGDVLRNARTSADLWPLWGTLRLPVLVIRGADSDILSVGTVERMRSSRPDLRVITVPERGHVPLLDEPGCVPSIDAFLRSLPD
jgi:pimeloyl-ACP methyl ester carboxylesterase